MDVRIGLANIRDISYILGSLRQGDYDEIECQLPRGLRPVDFAPACVSFGRSWVAYWKGVPAMAFGVNPITAAGNVMSGWSFGTRRAPGCFRSVMRFVRDTMMPAWVADGVTRIEARSISSHVLAHRWMEAIGAEFEADTPDFGRDGEAFKLYVWRNTAEMRSRLDSYCR